jgi:hypothetical protein
VSSVAVTEPRAVPSRTGLVVLAAVIAVAALLLRNTNGGWLLLFLGIPYIAMSIAHVLIHRKVTRTPFLDRRVLTSIALNHVVFVCAFLLQWDIGDSSTGTVTLETVQRPAYASAPAWLSIWIGIAALGIVGVSWLALLRARTPDLVGLRAAGVNAVAALVLAGIVVVASVQMYAEDQAHAGLALERAGGKAPASCGKEAMPTLRSDQQYYDGAIGKAPVWLHPYPFAVRSGDLVLDHLGDLKDGRVQTNWWVDPGFGRPITVSVADVTTNMPVRSNQFGRGAGAGTTQVLDPAAPFYRAGTGSRYLTYVVEFFIPRAGCYTVQAIWAEGGWSAPLAAGQ